MADNGESISLNDANFISKLCFKHYDKQITKNGKPNNSEWTTMSAIVVCFSDVHDLNKKFKILSLSTGSKCLPLKELPLDGSLIHDCHSEVLARRGFIRYVFNEFDKLVKNDKYKSDLFEKLNENNEDSIVTHKFKKHDRVKIYFLCSHTPCGDASIIPKTNETTDFDVENLDDECDLVIPAKKMKKDEELIDDIHRTGAKCVPNSSLQDSKEKGSNYHTVNALRTKPGRGEPTISMSCSDKLAKWLVVGIQGSLLSNLLTQPIYIDGLILSKCPFSVESVTRALIERSKEIKDLPPNYKCAKPFIIQSNETFQDSKYAKIDQKQINKDKLNACPTSICWSNVEQKPQIVLVRGNLLGVTTKPSKNKSKTRPLISKYTFFESFSKYLKNTETTTKLNYMEAKSLNSGYKNALKQFLAVYSEWICTDQNTYYQFKIE